jgi:AGZA family xanthine/uracil permease-like MFS transporter
MCLVGGVTAILKIIPLEAALGILIWIAFVIVSQAFSESDKKHGVAVVVGLIPALAAWALHVIETTLHATGTNLFDSFDRFGGELYIHGIISLYQGFLLISIFLSAILAYAIDRKFAKAAIWCFVAAVFSFFGLIHAYVLTPSGIHTAFGWNAAPWFTGAYATLGVMILVLKLTREA